MRQRIAAVTAAAALAVSGNIAISGSVASAEAAPATGTSAGAAGAAATCRVTGFTPNTVVVGLRPVTRTFSVRSSGCTWKTKVVYCKWGWHVRLGRPKSAATSVSLGAASNMGSTITFSPTTREVHRYGSFGSFGLVNSDAGSYHAVVNVWDILDQRDHERSWASGFHVKRANTWGSTFNAGPEPVKRGRAITIQGKLSMVNWNTQGLSDADWIRYRYLGHRSQYVKVQFRTLTGSYATVKTIKTNSSGWAKTTVTAGRTGFWRLVYAGNSGSGPGTASGDLVKVG